MSTNGNGNGRENVERRDGVSRTGPVGPSDPAQTNGKGLERRDFLKVLGVAGAGAAAAGCSGEPDRLIPYLVQPEQIVPGIATWYRTTCRECPAGCGMTIRTREGRAVKAEGSPASPVSHGRLCARGQASLHGLYDPDRSQSVRRLNRYATWNRWLRVAAERRDR